MVLAPSEGDKAEDDGSKKISSGIEGGGSFLCREKQAYKTSGGKFCDKDKKR